MQFEMITPVYSASTRTNDGEIIAFLHQHLEQYGDSREDIKKCLQYALNPAHGGAVIIGRDKARITGIAIINKTHMQGYIPENILVYIAVDNRERGKGYGRRLMQYALDHTEGAIALHVEPDNPARHLYEQLGFSNKYLEMRLQRQ